MKITKIACAGVLSLVLAGAGAAAAATAAGATTTTTPKASTCLPPGHDDAWPAYAQGEPVRDAGVRVWHDGTGWHVRVTHNTVRDRVFSGAILTSGTLNNVTPVRLEKNDYLKVSADKHLIAFRFNNYGGEDGFNFTTRCAPALAMGFVSDGHVLPTMRISIGARALHPFANPFVIKRTA